MRSGAPLTLTATAPVVVVMALARPSPVLVLAVAGLLVVTLVFGEALESERWRAGWRGLLRAHGAAACFGIAGCAAALLAGAAGSVPVPVAAAAAVVALVLVAGLTAMVARRLRR